MQQNNRFQPATNAENGALPKWVRWLFRFYAVYALFLMIASSFHLIYTLVSKNQGLMNDPVLSFGDSEALPLATEVIISLAVHGALLSLLLVFVIIGTLRLRKWVLPLVLIFSLHTIVVTTLSIFTGQLDGVAVLLFTLLNLGVAVVIGYPSMRYWSGFAGSTRRLLVQIPLLFFLLPHLVFPVLFALFPDDATINDQDLVLEPVVLLASEDNAHYALPNMDDHSEDIQELINTATRIMREDDGIDVTDPLVQSIVEETRELTDAFLVAAERVGYQCPTSVNNYSYDAVFCSIGDIQTLATLTSLRAQVEAETLGIDEGLLTAASIVQFSTHVTRAEQSPLIELLVGIAIQTTGMDAIEQILQTEEGPATSTVQAITTTLEEAEVPETALVNALRYEYTTHRETGKALAQYSNYFYQHNKTTNMFAQSTRYSIEAVEKGCGADTSAEEAAVEAMLDKALSAQNILTAVQPNFIGRVLFSVIASSFLGLNDSVCELNERNQELQNTLSS